MTRGRGEGSFSRLNDGRWVYQTSVGVVDGKRLRPRFYGRTKEEARDAAEEYRRRLRRGDAVRASRDTLGVYLEHWLGGLVRAHNTLLNYRNLVQNHLTPLHRTRLDELKASQIRQWQKDALDAGTSASTINLARNVLHGALEQAVRDGTVDRNVCALVRPLKVVRRRRQPLTTEQTIAFVQQARGSRLGPFYLTALGLGLRKNEVRGLLWSDIEGDVVHVQHQLARAADGEALTTLKTGTSGRRSLPLPAFVADALEHERSLQRFERAAVGTGWATNLPDFVFRTAGRPVEDHHLRADFRRQLSAAGLPPIHFHDLRHSCATLLLSLGVEMRVVQMILGHSSMATTEVYAQVMPELTRAAMQRIDRLLGATTEAAL